jgi:uncharacterized protein YbjT (DUF2867 family)
MSSPVLVIGATGTIGREVVRLLSAKGVPVRALVHSPGKAALVEGPWVEIARGDLAQPYTIEAAAEGVSRLLLLAPMDPRMAEWERAAIRAAASAGVRHIVHLSGSDADPESPLLLNRLHGQIDAELAVSGLEYTILQPDAMMQNVFGHIPTIASQGVFYAVRPNARMAMVDARDVAAVAVAALTELGHGNKTYHLTGPEALSMNDVAARLSAVLGRPVRCVDVPPDMMRKRMEAAGMPTWLASYVIGVALSYASRTEVKMTTDVADVTRKRPTVFDLFLSDHAGLYV